MDKSTALVMTMAKQCKSLIAEWREPAPNLPKVLQPKHLVWMCDQIEKHAGNGPTAKLHRWMGFVHCAILAHGILDMEGVKAMFEAAKRAHGDGDDAEEAKDLIDHLDPKSSFVFDIGGEA